MIATAALCAAVGASALESANTVGYVNVQTVEAAKNYIIGTQFESIGDTANQVFLDDLLTLSSTLTPGTWTDGDLTLGNAPKVMIFNGVGYDYYYYIDNATYDEYYKGEFVDYAEYPNNPCWATAEGIALKPYDVKMSLANGFWFRSPTTAGSLTINGQVTVAESVSVDIANAKNALVSSPFPITLKFSKITVTGQTVGTWTDGDLTLGGAPKLMIFNGVGYDYYYYIDNATYDEYYKGDFVDYAEYENNPCWATAEGIALDPYDVTIDAGKGFWARGNATGKLTFEY